MSPVTSNYTLYKRVLLMTSCSIAYVMTNHSTSDDVPIIRLYVSSTTDQLGNSIHRGIYFELLKRHRHLSLKMNFSLPDTMAVAGPSVVTEFIAPPNTCLDCYTTYGEFCVIYCGNFQKIVEWCQRHGPLLKEKQCPHCENVCRVDFSKKAWRCDKTYKDSCKRKKRCNFYVSLFKGSWFDHSHLDVESNLRFVYLFLQDWFSYKCVHLN